MRRTLLILGVIGMALALLAPTAGAATPYCGITWGSLPKEDFDYAGRFVTLARAGQHPCYDRFVIDVEGAQPGYAVRYGTQPVPPEEGGTGPVRGGAVLTVMVGVPAYDDDYHPSVPWTVGDELVDVTGFRTFREVAYGGSFEGETTFGLGVRARLPFRVFTLPGPDTGSRLVIDVAHRW